MSSACSASDDDKAGLLSCARCQYVVAAEDAVCGSCGVDQPDEGWSGDPFVGRFVAGRYRLEKRLAVGGFGIVFQAQQIDGDEELGQVAVKILRPDRMTVPDAKRRFLDEARSARRITTPHAIKVYDAGVDTDSTPYTVMELLTGDTVHELIRREGKLPPKRALRIADQVAAAMHESHGQNIIHRDLKPSNLVVGKDDFIKVIDFGIARTDADPSSTFTAIGSPTYIAPEQAAGEPVDGRADIYSLGVILIEMVTGKRIVIPGIVPDGLPLELERLCATMIAPYAHDRSDSMAAVREEIAKLLNTKRGTTKSDSPPAESFASPPPETEPATRGEPRRQSNSRLRRDPSEDQEATLSDRSANGGFPLLRAALAVLLVLGGLGVGWVIVVDGTENEPPAPIAQPPAANPEPASPVEPPTREVPEPVEPETLAETPSDPSLAVDDRTEDAEETSPRNALRRTRELRRAPAEVPVTPAETPPATPARNQPRTGWGSAPPIL